MMQFKFKLTVQGLAAAARPASRRAERHPVTRGFNLEWHFVSTLHFTYRMVPFHGPTPTLSCPDGAGGSATAASPRREDS